MEARANRNNGSNVDIRIFQTLGSVGIYDPGLSKTGHQIEKRLNPGYGINPWRVT